MRDMRDKKNIKYIKKTYKNSDGQTPIYDIWSEYGLKNNKQWHKTLLCFFFCLINKWSDDGLDLRLDVSYLCVSFFILINKSYNQ